MTIKRMRLVVVVAFPMLVACGPGILGAQTTGVDNTPKPNIEVPNRPLTDANSVIDPAKSLDASLTRVENLWMSAAQAMPAETYGFAPSAAIFVPSQKVQYDGVRTFAQILTHTIQGNYGAFSAIGNIKPEIDTKAITELKTKDEIVKALAATFAFAHKAVANVTAANAFQSVRGVQTPASMFAGAIGHAEDEYGQAVEYLRMNGIVPPASENKPKM